MAEVVLDASALLALLNGEAGAEVVAAALPEAVVSAVNLSEAVAKLVDIGIAPDQAWAAVERVARVVIPFDAEQARRTAALRAVTRRSGLGLGDRACLALGILREAAVLTADRSWATLKTEATVRLLRP